MLEDLNGGDEPEAVLESLEPFSTRENAMGVKRLVGKRLVPPGFVSLLIQEGNEFSNSTSKVQDRYALSNVDAGKTPQKAKVSPNSLVALFPP